MHAMITKPGVSEVKPAYLGAARSAPAQAPAHTENSLIEALYEISIQCTSFLSLFHAHAHAFMLRYSYGAHLSKAQVAELVVEVNRDIHGREAR